MTTRVPPDMARATRWIRRRPWWTIAIMTAVFLAAPRLETAAANAVHRVVQKNRAFNLRTLEIAAGDDVEFSDEDDFLHQVFVSSPDFSFDTAEQQPGEVIRIQFPVRGTFVVHCHIHPKMALTVTVR